MPKVKLPKNLRSIIFFLLMIGLTWLVITRFASFHDLITRLIQGNLLWVSLAILIHLFFFYINATLYHSSFKTVEVNLSAIQLLPVLLASLFVNAVVPTGGAGGAAVFVDYAAQRGYPGSRVLVGVLLDLIVDLFTLIPFVLAGVFYLLSQHHLKFYEWLAFLMFVIFIGGMITVLFIAYHRPKWINKLFSKVRGIVNWFGERIRKPELLKSDWVERNSQEFIDGSQMIAKHPRQLYISIAWGTYMHVVNMLGLYLFFLAYGQTVNFGTIDAAFSLGIVFFVVAIIPQGVGAVEGIMSLVLINMGMDKTNAAVIAVAFRGVNFWIPIIAGFFTYHFVTQPRMKKT